MAYRPPFVSERIGDAGHFVDCTFAAGMMTLAAWTWGEATSNDHVPLDAGQLADLRHKLRPHGDGGSNPLDVDKAVQKLYPDLPHMPSWDNPQASLRIDFPTWKKRIQAGECGILQGNAVKVKAKGSPLHKFVGDVGHALYVESSPDPAQAKVLDPMGTPVGSYEGDRVSWKDLEEFASAFTTSHVFVSLVVKGEQFSANVVQRKLDKTTQQLKAADNAATTAKVAMTAAIAAQKAAELALGTCPADLLAAQTALATADTTYAELTVKLADATSYGEAQGRLATAANEDLVKATEALAICQSGAELGAAKLTIADLQRRLDTCNASLAYAAKSVSFVTWLKRALGRLP